MKRLCCYCKRLIGHKCRNCANDNAALISSQPAGWLECMVCGHRWPAERDGATHGICAECLEKHRPRSAELARRGGPVADATGEP